MANVTASFIATQERWMDEALCKKTPHIDFFPTRGQSTDDARAVCMVCPVKDECLEFALRLGEKYGIWGGTSERERRELRRQRRIEMGMSDRGPMPGRYRKPIQHGHENGYATHLRYRETPCDACRAAHAVYKRHRVAAWRQAKRDAQRGDAA